MIAEIQRREMVCGQIERRGIRDPRVLDAIRTVPRECFVPDKARELAHQDHPLGIGHGQTISQPYIVALMTELLELPDQGVVLEVGAGCGYQSAILAQITDRVCAIELIPELARSARTRLEKLGYHSIDLRCGDGFQGWPEPDAKFDGIIVACAPPEIPRRLVEQLRPGAHLVLPVGPPGQVQNLTIATKSPDGTTATTIWNTVRFVPMLHN